MNFKTHAPARREGTTLQPNIHTIATTVYKIENLSHLCFGFLFTLLATIQASWTFFPQRASPPACPNGSEQEFVSFFLT
jgi:hypothetical protein